MVGTATNVRPRTASLARATACRAQRPRPPERAIVGRVIRLHHDRGDDPGRRQDREVEEGGLHLAAGAAEPVPDLRRSRDGAATRRNPGPHQIDADRRRDQQAEAAQVVAAEVRDRAPGRERSRGSDMVALSAAGAGTARLAPRQPRCGCGPRRRGATRRSAAADNRPWAPRWISSVIPARPATPWTHSRPSARARAARCRNDGDRLETRRLRRPRRRTRASGSVRDSRGKRLMRRSTIACCGSRSTISSTR